MGGGVGGVIAAVGIGGGGGGGGAAILAGGSCGAGGLGGSTTVPIGAIFSTTAGVGGTTGSDLSDLGMSTAPPPHKGQKGLSQSIMLKQRIHFFMLKLPFKGVSLLQNYIIHAAFIIYHTFDNGYLAHFARGECVAGGVTLVKDDALDHGNSLSP